MEAWPAGTEDAIGQAGEFLVWAAFITQSGGGLHVFLPTLDRGIDGLIHRLWDGAFFAAQIKTKTEPHRDEAPIAVLETHLFTDDQLVIGVHLDGNRLGEYALVVDGATFRRKAGRIEDRGRMLLVADMPLRPIAGHKWSEDLVRTDQLAARLGAKLPALGGPPSAGPSDEDRVIGNWGELEVIRLLAQLEDCGLFRPFPDNETAEVAVRRLATGATIGLQVKTSELSTRHDSRHVLVLRSSFVPSPTTYLVALAWIGEERRFHETCLLIPTDVLRDLAGTSGPYFKVFFKPDGGVEPGKFDSFRIPLESLPSEISKRL